MKKINKKIIVSFVITSFVFGFIGANVALALPSTPSLGAAGTFGVLSSSYINTVVGTTISGDLGYTTGPALSPTIINGTDLGLGGNYSQAGTDQGVALVALNSQACTHTFPAGAVDLATNTTHGPIGIYTPGVYCNMPTSATSIGTSGITLDGAGTYIFRMDGALTTVANSTVKVINGASSCDIFWTPTSATTLGANTTFLGTVIDAAGITVGNTTNWNGRALAFGGTVTTDTDMITSACLVSNIETPQLSGSTSSGSDIVYGCKDPIATNYNYFSVSNPALCEYSVVSTVVTPSIPSLPVTPLVIIPKLPKTGFGPEIIKVSWLMIQFTNFMNLFR